MTRIWQFFFYGCAALAVSPGTLPGAEILSPDSVNDTASGSLIIQSTPDSALVMIDAKPAGSTPFTLDSISPGVHLVTIQNPNMESWLTESVSDTIQIVRGEKKVLRYDLRTRYVISSSPFGADVVRGDSVVGTTPFLTELNMDRELFTLHKTGYESEKVQLSSGQRTLVEVPLKKVWQSEGNGESYFKEGDRSGSESAGLYLSGGATIVSGVAAAYFKISADNRYQRYVDTGDRKLLNQTHRLDTAAGVAIVVTQIGLGLFTYFIFSH